MNMQQQYYSDEEGPSGDDLYTQEGGKDGNRAPQGPHGPAAAVPPGYVDSSTRSAAHGATQGELLPFWPKDPNSWFTLADSTFLQVKVASSRLIYLLIISWRIL